MISALYTDCRCQPKTTNRSGYLAAAQSHATDMETQTCLNTRCKPRLRRSVIISTLQVDIARGILRVRTRSLARHLLLPHPSRLTRTRARAKEAEREWLKEHRMKLDWIKCKAEGGGRRNPATHTPIRDPSLDAGFSGLSIKTSSNQPSTVNPHLWKRRFSLIATCRPLGSATAFPALSRKQRLRT
jgi:hypothetical protein